MILKLDKNRCVYILESMFYLNLKYFNMSPKNVWVLHI